MSADANSPIMVTMRHVRAARLDGVSGVNCAHSIRAWCKKQGIDLCAFARDGMPIEQAEAITDAFAQRAVAIARAEAEAGNG